MPYPIKKEQIDFIFLPDTIIKGTRRKRIAFDIKEKQVAFFKYEEYNCTESCSEKMSYEIAKVLGYLCARIELAQDENGVLGVLNYLFVNTRLMTHTDAVSYITEGNIKRKQFYTITNIKNCLDSLDSTLFYQFMKILVFDALIGETDRHEENWGISIENGKYSISPLYDNGCNLLREFKNRQFAEKYYNGYKNFESYIERCKSLIYNEANKKKYTHFELIKRLYKEYPDDIKQEIDNLDKLTDKKIEEIVNNIPHDLMDKTQREYIIKFIKVRKQKLQKIVN